ncbi:metallophosphoesterase [Bradyrhizobium jicamae]|uniref:Metallophosphoesterase n=1 Tax=Bradyrhizobium jicamae TaxID=280332 RepID=A0ABS5FAS8_9BRAD|nr:metallophosphoesterase [Bradyrhizobium jicamae]MBR0793892.1 metallophosphoesterase [Bradyrhizobium jicamae]MBR0933336.1 metallophosphoesterase [Bradyrhizobium jicamae]
MISRRQFLYSAGGLTATSASTAAYGVSEPVVRLALTRYDLSPRRWPADFPLKIAVIADIHACDPWMSLDRISEIVDRTNALNADIIVMLGDYVAGLRHVTRFIPASEWAAVLAGLKAPLGVHAILGNHDYWEDKALQRRGEGTPPARRALEHVGIPVYENDAVRLVKDGRPFWLAGLGDQLAYMPARRFRHVAQVGVDDLGATLAQVTDDAPVILLAHEPDIAVRVPSRVALQLSGHTHGGQVRLLGWSPAVPVKHGMRLAYGHLKLKTDVIVSGGLGCSIMPFRLGVPPEIVQVTLGARGPAMS